MATLRQRLNIIISQLSSASYSNKLNDLVDVASCISLLIAAINLTSAGLELTAQLTEADRTGIVFIEQATVPGGAPPPTKATLWVQNTIPNTLIFTGDENLNFVIGGLTTFKSTTFTTQGIGNGTFYTAGFYDAPAADANLSQAGASTTFGGTNDAIGAHVFAVTGGVGVVASGTVALRVAGTSITDAGVRTVTDSEDIITDITTTALNSYFESTKKWIGTVTWTLVITSGAPATYSLDINYGFAKYDDLGNMNFTVTDFEVITLAGANDSGYDVALLHHETTGWLYSAASFVPGANTIVQMSDDYGTERELGNGNYSSYKRSGLSQTINGNDGEGFVVRFVTTANNAIEIANIHVGSRITN